MLPPILLVDDEEDILEYLTLILSKKYSILTADNGQEALQILNKEAVHLVISDVMMPEMNGFELCKTIKSNLEYCHIPIILLTAKNTIQSKVDGLELGADAYIEKPFSKEHLQAQIASLLSNRNMIREYFASSPLVHLKSIAHSKTDERFLETLHEIIYKNIEDVDLDVEKLAKIMNMSRPTLFRKIKAISNMTPYELITLTRLKKAAELLIDGQYKIYEVSDMIGYHHQSNFTRDFHKQFKMTPTEYMNSKLSGRSLKSKAE
ncbi:response regulator [Chitinophagaceae bacterium LB-8]|uniref:Response regulator n=1 Tax=Paraflavisolibacter caeni TaxID=2982496 RepID=A0A9X2XZM6_9BACT|nr:response regulator [Paraflavisolibacter caeni]MCU7551847.1 response regulator [Paraflavisolibacter caeni]